LRWYDHISRKDDNDWVKKYMDYGMEGIRSRGRPRKRSEVVEKDCQARKMLWTVGSGES